MKRVMIVLGVLILVGLVDCGKSEEEKKKGLVGTYVNKDDASEYFDLEEDGTYHYHHEKLGYDLTGKWEVKGDKLIVSYSNTGPMPASKIQGNEIIGDDGSVHIKVKSRSPAPPKPDSIPGEYIDEQGEVLIISNDGTFKFKEPIVRRMSRWTGGLWKINGDKIAFYVYLAPGIHQTIESGDLSGEIKANTIYSTDGTIWIKQGEVKETDKGKTSPDKEISKDSIAGRYVVEAVKNDGTVERPPGVTILQEDGSIKLESAGLESVVPDTKWEFRDGVVQIYPYGPDGTGERLTGEVKGDTITFRLEEGELRYIKEGAKTVSSVKQISKVDNVQNLQFPLKGNWKPIRLFNIWNSDWCGRHLGEDIERKPETPVSPMAGGTVKFAKYQPEIGIGYGVIIEHNLNGEYLCSVYYHMRKPKAEEVLKEGQLVSPDKPIGYISGEQKDHLSVPHLHFGVRKGKYLLGRDPRTNRWYYPGYTAIYNKDGTKESNPDDPKHEEISKEWHKPSEFINAHLATLSPKAESGSGEPIMGRKTTLDDLIKAARTWQPTFTSWFGKSAPDFTLTDITGQQHKLNDYRGKDIMVIFWASWANPCRMEIPHLIQIRNTIGEDKLAMLAISNEDLAVIKEFVSRQKINYTVFSYQGDIPTPFNLVNSIPCSFFINPEGKIKLATTGMLSLAEIKAILNAEFDDQKISQVKDRRTE